MKKLQLEIVTVEKTVRKDTVDSVVLPTPLGETGILYNHIPLIISLDPGELRIKKDDKTEPFAISGGFAEVQSNKVTILADAAEHAEEIDIKKAEEAKKRAEDTMKRKDIKKEEFQEAAAELRRSIAMIKVAKKKYRKLRGH